MSNATDRSAVEVAASAVAMLESVQAALEGASGCAARAQALRAWQAANGSVLESVRADMHAHAGAELQREVQTQLRTNRRLTALFAESRDCLADDDFAAAWSVLSKVMD